MSVDSLIDRLDGDPGYIRFLLVERPYIRSALLARGVCMDEEARTLAYPSTIGNALHNDLIEIEQWLDSLAPRDRRLILDWAEGQSSRPSFGGSQMGRINRLVKAYINERSAGRSRPSRGGHERGAAHPEERLDG